MVELDRFTAERLRAQLSTEPVDETAAEALLVRAYAAAGLDAPRHIHWLGGPLELVSVLAHGNESISVEDQYREMVPHCVWDDVKLDQAEIGRLERDIKASIDSRVRELMDRAERSVETAFQRSVQAEIRNRVRRIAAEPLEDLIGERIWRAVGSASGSPVAQLTWRGEWSSSYVGFWHSISAYEAAPELAMLRFYDTYLAPNKAGALARFNESVSGYWLGAAVALLVRKPSLLSRDARGRLHSATGPAVTYPDGWSIYAWHGVSVPAWVILTPYEELTREDFLNQSNVEARRVIQERMGDRFVWELNGKFIDGGPRGILYEVQLPDRWERVARYVYVKDASTDRMYFLQVPPSIQTAAEAVAWTFGLTEDEYHPTHET
jgi:hypothetical protein